MHSWIVRFLALVIALPAFAENWPQFRGPRGDGSSGESSIPTRWSPTENIQWKTDLPGEGHSSPIVWGDALFMTAVRKESGERLLIRLDARTGKIVWEKNLFQGAIQPMHRENSSASSTPVTDGTHVFTSFQNGERADLRCYDFSGALVWSIQPLEYHGEHGYSHSPVLLGDLLIFDCRQEGEAATLGIEKATGKIRWRNEPAKKRISHIPPLVINQGKQVVVSGSNETKGLDPSTGRAIWWCRGPSDVSVAGLVEADGVVFATAGYPMRTRMAIRTDGEGDVTDRSVLWSIRKQVTYVPGPVYEKGYLYAVLDEGMACCIDPKTGEAVWEERLGGRYRSSLVVAHGLIYATNDQGATTVFAADPKQFRKIASNNLSDFCYSTPAISGGRIFLRTGKGLWCIASR